MSILYLVLPLAILVAAAAVAAYIWSARAGQFDDLDTPAVRMLHDDEPARNRPLATDHPASTKGRQPNPARHYQDETT